MILLLTKKLGDKALYDENISRLRQLLKFQDTDLKIDIKPGNKIDVLDINKLKWSKGEIIKCTNVCSTPFNKDSSISEKSTPVLLHIEYKIDGTKHVGYYKSDSILLAPNGYFTNEEMMNDDIENDLNEFTLENSDESPGRMIRVLNRINRLLTTRIFNNQIN